MPPRYVPGLGLLLGLLFGASAHAAAPDEAVLSADGTMLFSASACPRLARSPEPTAGVDYVPGVDVDGAAVAPAEVPDLRPPLDNLPLAIRLQSRGRRGKDGESTIGLLTLRDGRIYLDGQALSAPDQAALVAACRSARRK